MKIDAYYKFSDEQMKLFPQIKDNTLIVTINSDYVENVDDVISIICDEIY